MYKVTCTGAANAAVANPCNAGARVTVTVVDLCPSPGCTVTFDLSQQAFSTIASLDAGEILIDYQLEALWNGGAACGSFYTVTCTGGTNETPNPCNPGTSVTVKIVDLCPSPGCQATLDLSEQAFSIIGNLNAGKIAIDYEL
ncbi:hypothetical protein HU200_006001 [Digitaria exilis]|uniref:Expansin-like EG45 domain-containing protein n=1 Tax=Digitaria exilis TaxID=1010633 RepID=A0A835KS72_9POAL|nr:hypothetical protein HU200_006001 [Digitaria exilis]